MQAVVSLLPEFGCFMGDSHVTFSPVPGRVLIHLALRGEVTRKVIAASLWPDTEPLQAARRLSQALWRIRGKTGSALLKVDADRLSLARDVSVDYCAAKSLAHNVLSEISPPADADPLVLKLLGSELLRGVEDEEIAHEQDRWDRLRSLALEKIAEALLQAGDPVKAIEVALTASQVDTFAESPRLILASAYLTLGDTVSARRVYLEYTRLVRRELQTDPSAAFRDLISLERELRTR
ncbi:BTAD domain-containing putative transcriptional regulator [Actinomadura sp. 6N118]